MKRVACALVLAACGGSAPSATPPASPAPTVTSTADADADASTATSTATSTPTPTPDAPDDSGDPAGVAYLESVQVLLKAHRDDLTKACWLKSKSTERAYAGKSVIRVGPGGKVISIQTDGTDDTASACITKQLKKWKLPPPNGTATVTLPIRLHRD